jgi:hypothetical protein
MVEKGAFLDAPLNSISFGLIWRIYGLNAPFFGGCDITFVLACPMCRIILVNFLE